MPVADSEAQAVRLVEDLGHVVVVGKLKTMWRLDQAADSQHAQLVDAADPRRPGC